MIPWQSSSFNELMDLPFYSPIQSVQIYDDFSFQENILSGEAKSHSQIRNSLSQGERSKERDNHRIYQIKKYNFKTAHSLIKKLALESIKDAQFLQLFTIQYKKLLNNMSKFVCLIQFLRINKKLLLIQKLWLNYAEKFLVEYRKRKSQLEIEEMQKLLLQRSFLAISSKDYFEALKKFWGDCKHNERFDENIEIIEKNLNGYKIIAMYYTFNIQV